MSQIVIVGTTGCKVKDWVSAASRLPLLQTGMLDF